MTVNKSAKTTKKKNGNSINVIGTRGTTTVSVTDNGSSQ